MKKINLAENMLRFGVKNLDRVGVIKLKRLVEQTQVKPLFVKDGNADQYAYQISEAGAVRFTWPTAEYIGTEIFTKPLPKGSPSVVGTINEDNIIAITELNSGMARKHVNVVDALKNIFNDRLLQSRGAATSSRYQPFVQFMIEFIDDPATQRVNPVIKNVFNQYLGSAQNSNLLGFSDEVRRGIWGAVGQIKKT